MTAFLRVRDTDLLSVASDCPCFQAEQQTLRVAVSQRPGASSAHVLVDVPGSLETVFPRQWFAKAFGATPERVLDLYFPDLHATVDGAEVRLIDTPGTPILGLGVLHRLCTTIPPSLSFSPTGVFVFRPERPPHGPPAVPQRGASALAPERHLAWSSQTVVVRINFQHSVRLHVARTVPCDVVLSASASGVQRAMLHTTTSGRPHQPEPSSCCSYAEDETGTAYPLFFLRCPAQATPPERHYSAACVVPSAACVTLGITTKPPPASGLGECCGWISLDYLTKNDLCTVKHDGTIIPEVFGHRHIPILSVTVPPLLGGLAQPATTAARRTRSSRPHGLPPGPVD